MLSQKTVIFHAGFIAEGFHDPDIQALQTAVIGFSVNLIKQVCILHLTVVDIQQKSQITMDSLFSILLIAAPKLRMKLRVRLHCRVNFVSVPLLKNACQRIVKKRHVFAGNQRAKAL